MRLHPFHRRGEDDSGVHEPARGLERESLDLRHVPASEVPQEHFEDVTRQREGAHPEGDGLQLFLTAHADHLDTETNRDQRAIVLLYFAGYYDQKALTIWYDEKLRLDPATRRWAPDATRTGRPGTALVSFRPDIDYVGLRNPDSQSFCIQERPPPTTTTKDMRLFRTGRRCVNWSKEKLIEVAKHLDLDTPDETTVDEYWRSRNRQYLCKRIQDWFDENNLMFPDRNCGTSTKRKKDAGVLKLDG